MLILVDLLARGTVIVIAALMILALPLCWAISRSRYAVRYILLLAALHAAAAVMSLSAGLGFALTGNGEAAISTWCIFLVAAACSWCCVSAARRKP